LPGNAVGQFSSPKLPALAPDSASEIPFTIDLPMYSAQLLDHFQNPRNAGEIADPDAAAEIENPVCGDVLRLTLKGNAGRITEAQFKAKGCVAAIACGSALTELIIGTTMNEALRLRREDLTGAVGGLPQASTHAAQLALDALSLALTRIKIKS
jgi:nitrogen fixation protein NifU and related proteins